MKEPHAFPARAAPAYGRCMMQAIGRIFTATRRSGRARLLTFAAVVCATVPQTACNRAPAEKAAAQNAPAQNAPAQANWSSVDQALGRSGKTQPDGVQRYSFPRSDLNV